VSWAGARALVRIVIATQVATACAPSISPSPEVTQVVTETRTCPATPAEITYGCGVRAGGSITYQPDVEVIRDGASAIKGWGSDGLTWTLDGKAAGVNDITPGRVLLVTGLAVGRVVAVEPSGADRIVTLGPVQIGDVIKDGVIASAGPVALDGAVRDVAPDLPGRIVDGIDSTASRDLGRMPFAKVPDSTVSLAAPRPTGTPAPTPVPPPSEPELQIGGGASFTNLYCCTDRIGGDFWYEQNQLKFRASVWLNVSKPTAEYTLTFVDGKLDAGYFAISGLRSIHVDINTAIADGVNLFKGYMLPMQFRIPLETGSSATAMEQLPPLNLAMLQIWTVHTRFTARTSKLVGSADYDINGGGTLSVAISHGAINPGASSFPTGFTPKNRFLDSITGLSIGVGAATVGMNVRFCICFGAYYASDGLFYQLNNGFSIANDSSAVGLIGGRCRFAEYEASVRVGNGHYFHQAYIDELNRRRRDVGPAFTSKGGEVSDPISLWDTWASVPEGLRRCNIE
jgi:hypothetical protein